MDKKRLLEFVKELARTGLLAAVSAMVVYLGEVPSPDTTVLALLVILRGLDKWLHLVLKERSSDRKWTGLSPI